MAGEHADGVLPLLYPPEHFSTAASQVAEGAERAGRKLTEIDLPPVSGHPSTMTQKRASAELAGKIAYYGASFAPFLLSRAGLTVSDFGPIQKHSPKETPPGLVPWSPQPCSVSASQAMPTTSSPAARG